ncbi:MAG: aspartate 1-decarboxylase [Legionella longbeachae]|nr:aspartate 1-decarboxylase [Legionella longbeachae]
MLVTMLKAKIHRDEKLLLETGIRENEKVQIVNINNGSRFETYVIKGRKGSGDICVNGAAARLVHEGDKIIIICYCTLDEQKAQDYIPKIIFMNEDNSIQSHSHQESSKTLFLN